MVKGSLKVPRMAFDKLCELACIGPYGDEYQGLAHLHEPEGAHEICLIKGFFS